MVLFIWRKPIESLRSLYFSAAWFICYSCRPRPPCPPPPPPTPSLFSASLSPSVPLCVSCSLLPALPCMWFSFSSCAVSPRFMESWMSCHFQLPRIYSPDERMWEEECSNRDVKHWRFIMNNTDRGGKVLYRLKESYSSFSEWKWSLEHFSLLLN